MCFLALVIDYTSITNLRNTSFLQMTLTPLCLVSVINRFEFWIALRNEFSCKNIADKVKMMIMLHDFVASDLICLFMVFLCRINCRARKLHSACISVTTEKWLRVIFYFEQTLRNTTKIAYCTWWQVDYSLHINRWSWLLAMSK